MPRERDERGAGAWPLSPVQRGLLLHHGDGNTAYIDQMLCHMNGDLDLSTFRQTLAHLIQRHDSLRCRFTNSGAGRMRQEVMASAPVGLAFRDISDAQDPHALVDRFASLDVVRGFDLSVQTQRCYLFRLSASEHLFLWTYHHVIADSWTLRILQDQFCEIYRELYCFGQPPIEPTPSLQEYVHWVGLQDEEEARAFWRGYLTHYRKTGDQHGSSLQREAPSAAVEIRLGGAARADVEAARRAYKATTNAVLLAVWALCALDLSQKRECLVGCVTAGRGVPVEGIERMAGAVANTVPAFISDEVSLSGLVRQLRDHAFSASRYAYLSLGDIMASAGLRPADLHSVVNFTLDRREVKSKHLDDLPFAIPVVRYNDRATFSAYLDVEVEDRDVCLTVRYDLDSRFVCADTIRRKIPCILRALVERPDSSVRQVLDTITADDFDGGDAPLYF